MQVLLELDDEAMDESDSSDNDRVPIPNDDTEDEQVEGTADEQASEGSSSGDESFGEDGDEEDEEDEEDAAVVRKGIVDSAITGLRALGSTWWQPHQGQ